MSNEVRITTVDEEARRARRASWPVRQLDLGSEPNDDLSAATTAEERLAMMWPLALDAFGVGPGVGQRTPRETWPIRVRRLGEAEVL